MGTTRPRVKSEKPKEKEISEVKVLTNAEEVNQLLMSGWHLLHGNMSHIDGLGYNCKPTFILGKK